MAKQFGVSTETIRKDLIYLENKGLLKRNNGSAEVLNEFTESDFAHKSEKNIEQKELIATKAASLIPQGSTVFFDSGSTIYHTAKKLLMRNDITAVTNFIPIASLFSAHKIRTIMIGGEIRIVSGAASGQLALDNISRINANIALLATSGFANSDGPCVESFAEASVKAAMIKHSVTQYLLTDSSKANCRVMVNFAKWNELDYVITDDGLSAKDEETIKRSCQIIKLSCKN